MSDQGKLNVIAIGASAGGLEALQDFFSHLPPLDNCCFVVAQHLSPIHKSMLVQLLSRQTSIAIEEAMNGDVLRPNKIYITPPDKEISVGAGKIRLEKPSSSIGPKPSVDVLFKSLSMDEGNQMIGIILSGTGSDGSSGVIDLKRNGAYIIVQEPETAKYDGMPMAAIQTGMADAILAPEKMGEEIMEYINNPGHLSFSISDTAEDGSSLSKVFNLLSKRTGTDFSNYKSATIGRRLQKRLAYLHIDSIEDYLKIIEKNPKEIDEMFNMILIGVTTFFRDIEAFGVLEDCLQKIIKRKTSADPIRIWVPGSSTGEEAYSIAILLTRLLKDKIGNFNIQIFATDIDERAIAKARKGIYQASSMENLPAEIQKEYFIKKGKDYELVKSIRSLVLFSKHDLTKNPPFLKLDLISCRNLLIYFNNILQQQIIPIFHYATNQDGYLFLGKSESVGHFNDLFATIDTKNKIFQRKRGGHLNTLKFSAFKSQNQSAKKISIPIVSKQLSIPEMVKETLFNTFEHPYVVIDEYYDIVEVNGDVRLFLSLSSGIANVNLLKMVSPELQIEVRSIVTKSIKDRIAMKSNIKKFELYGQIHYVRFIAKPLIYTESSEELFVVIFEKLDINEFLDKGVAGNLSSTPDTRMLELEVELSAVKEQLQAYIEEIETSNEELQSLNEELQSTNEELQSSNEELETSNEELQSTNEEINVAYYELKSLHENLERKEMLLKENEANINALLDNEQQAFILVDKSYRILKYNQKAVKIFKLLVDKNIQEGNTFIDLLPSNHLESFIKDFKVAIDGKIFSGEKQLVDASGQMRWFSLNYSPVKIEEGVVKGVSVGFLDITDLKLALFELSAKDKMVNSVFNATSTGICITDKNGLFIDVNNQYCRIYGYNREELIGKSFLVVVPEESHQYMIDMHAEFIQNGNDTVEEFQVRHKTGKLITVAVSAELLIQQDGERYKITSVLNISKQKEEEHRLRLMESVVINTNDSILITEADNYEEPGPRIIYVNEAFTRMTGYTPDEILGKSPRILQGPKTDRAELERLKESMLRWQPCEITTVNYKKNGEEFWVNFSINPVKNDEGWVTHWIAVERDVTKQKTNELQKALISEITTIFNQNDNLKATLESVLQRIVDFSDFCVAETWLISTDRNRINLIAKHAKSDKYEVFYDKDSNITHFKLGEGLPGKVWKSQKRELFHNINKKNTFQRKEAAIEAGLNTFYGLPLFYNNDIVGVMIIGMEKDILSKNSFDLSLNKFEDYLGAEIKRKQLEEELNQIFNFAPDIICIIGFDGYFKRINPATCTLLEYTEEELLSIPISQIIHPNDVGNSEHQFKVGDGNETFYYENRLITKLGKEISLGWTSTPYLEEGLIYAVAKDITHRIKSEETLKELNLALENRAKELVVSNLELEQFAYVASHDLQEPLRTISSFLTQLEKKYSHSLDDKAQKYIEFAVDGAMRMRQIILDLLEFSRVGKNDEKLEQVNINEVIQEVVSLQGKNILDKKATVSFKDLPKIYNYRYPLMQIFQNLIGNALKYSKRDTAPKIKISYEELSSHHKFIVEDNGIGIDPAYADKIFIIFQRLHSKNEFSGSGMGLAIVKKIVESLGGTIWVESTENEGSTFYFTIRK